MKFTTHMHIQQVSNPLYAKTKITIQLDIDNVVNNNSQIVTSSSSVLENNVIIYPNYLEIQT